ncbi:MAG TPA: response regulator [Longimicrobiales bacterium]|nr:response regulator [Longimicrobiales bacterium]
MATILVVDDSAYARRLMRKNLEAAGHQVFEADGGMAAIESFFLHHPDVVLLDLTMEDLSGMEVLRKLREMNADARVIVVSADVQSSTETLVREAGGTAFLGKPVSSEQLLRAIEAALGGSHVE